MNHLENIIKDCKIRLGQDKQTLPLAMMEEHLYSRTSRHRSFVEALHTKVRQQKPAIIAEVKQKSPSEGQIADNNFDPVRIASGYEMSGATCLSILCERDWFGGNPKNLTNAREKTTIPLMRKDFIFDSYQIVHSKYIGADCILLILSILDDVQAKDLEAQALQMGLDVLIEAHNKEELERALGMQSPLIGINNRNLENLSVEPKRTMAFAREVAEDRILIAESGLRTAQDIRDYLSINVYCFLIGTAFMKTPSPSAALERLQKELEK